MVAMGLGRIWGERFEGGEGTIVTWVIGGRGFNLGVALSDIQLTHEDGTPENDFGLQKVHAINDFSALGFAGSVALGLKILRRARADLGEFMDMGAPLDEQVERWVDSLPKDLGASETQEVDLDLLFLRLSPDHNMQGKTTSGGRLPITMAEGCIVRALGTPLETFFPAESIGSGSGVPECTAAVKEFVTMDSLLEAMKIGQAAPGYGFEGIVLAVAFDEVIRKHAGPTVSPHLHSTVITLEYGVDTRRSASLTKLDWPPIALTWDDVVDLSGHSHIDPRALHA